ncbi:type II secretion system F family protein [Ramlibacter sp. AW1]|uniref:Type II secretion system F family protein n=2 Tax=Ramlibacter aurantiacus TaxID=2801330 RepID=A0A936ZRA3_9BURK|nr:type II secretion system F family protein [Ramlibacter aurantiacus]
MLFAPNRSDQRLRELTGAQREAGWTEAMTKVAAPLARLSVPEGSWETSPLRIRFLNAGIRREDARVMYFAAKTVLPLVLALLVFTTMSALGFGYDLPLLLNVLLAALVGCYLPNGILSVMRRRRQREIFESFPDAADLLLVCVEAGLGLDSAMAKVADEIRRKSPALADELHLTNLELRAGATREQTLRNLALRTGVEEVVTFATMLTQADKFGTSIGDSLRVFSDDLRYKRQVMAEERAAKIPVKMLFPLVLFIFPSIIAVILGPAAIQIIRTLMPMLQ